MDSNRTTHEWAIITKMPPSIGRLVCNATQQLLLLLLLEPRPLLQLMTDRKLSCRVLFAACTLSVVGRAPR